MGKIMRRVLIIVPAAALQVLWHLMLIKWLSPYAPLIESALSVVAFFLVLYIIIKRDESTYKLLWLLVILTMPLVGTLLYLFFGNMRTAKPLKNALRVRKAAAIHSRLKSEKRPLTAISAWSRRCAGSRRLS